MKINKHTQTHRNIQKINYNTHTHTFFEYERNVQFNVCRMKFVSEKKNGFFFSLFVTHKYIHHIIDKSFVEIYLQMKEKLK